MLGLESLTPFRWPVVTSQSQQWSFPASQGGRRARLFKTPPGGGVTPTQGLMIRPAPFLVQCESPAS